MPVIFAPRTSGRHHAKHQYTVFAKHADWADESEYRLFVASDSQEDFYVPIDSGMIVGLVLGPCFDVANMAEVETFAGHFGISSRVRGLCWSRGFLARSL